MADDVVAALTALQDQATLPTGAKAAGVGGDRYNLIRSTFSEATSYRWPRHGSKEPARRGGGEPTCSA